MIISISTQRIAGPEVPITCPACKALVAASSIDNVETVKLMFVVPVFEVLPARWARNRGS